MDYYQKLLALQRAESAAIGSLSSKLRLTPSSLRNDRGHLHHKQPGYTPPWEMYADPDSPPPWERAVQRQQWPAKPQPEPKPKPRRAKPAPRNA
jgi:hypothetical protein